MTVLSTPPRFDRAFFLGIADWLAVGVAVALPWSTSASGIFIALWLVVVLATMDLGALKHELLTPAGGLPVLLWALALLGMLWAGNGVSWTQRFRGLEGYLRLLAIPLLLTQFVRSDKGPLVIYGFLISEVGLVLTSWAFDLVPMLQSHGNFPGVPVKDYIFQSDEFLVCGFSLLGIAGELAIKRQWWVAI